MKKGGKGEVAGPSRGHKRSQALGLVREQQYISIKFNLVFMSYVTVS